MFGQMLYLMNSISENQTIDLMAKTMICISIVTFIYLFRVKPAEYGRYNSAQKANAIKYFVIGARKAWVFQEFPSFILPLCIFLLHYKGSFNFHVWCLTMFLIHYFHRTFIYPFFIRGGKPSPGYIVLLAFTFCLYNGYMQGRHLYLAASNDHVSFISSNSIIGSVLFLLGLSINLHSDHLLRNLRKPGDSSYRIPEGGLFSLVSCANYLGEVIEWWGFAVATWSLPGLAFAIFTMCNLVPRAVDHHKCVCFLCSNNV